ncbi:TolC family protein [Ewingella sp. S1.OA.A_B6]
MPLKSLCFSAQLLLAGMPFFVHAAPLTFSYAVSSALQQSPELSASQTAIHSAQSSAIPAGSLPDPKLITGLDNFPVSGPMANSLTEESMTMEKIGLMQEIPNSAKRDAREEVASAQIQLAGSQHSILQVDVAQGAAVAWLSRYYLEQQLGLLHQLERENDVLGTALQAQIVSGRTPLADSLNAGEKQAELADREDQLQGELRTVIANLSRYIGADAQQPLVGSAPDLSVDAATYLKTLHKTPKIQAYNSETAKAKAELRAAQAEKKPDWSVELDYQRRDPQYGNMVSVQFTVGLPVFAASRQDPLITAKTLDLTQVGELRDAAIRQQTNQLNNDLADYATLTHQIQRIDQRWLPLARQKVTLLNAGYARGTSDSAALINARSAVLEQQIRKVGLQSQRAQRAATLYYTFAGVQQ